MTDLGIPGVGDATLIASGGSALVYEALSGTGERLAVKVLRGVRSDEVLRRFEREQSAAERLFGHQHIMRIHHNGLTDAGEPYLVMPLAVRGSLHDELERSGKFSLEQALADVACAVDAIEFAHDRGVLHRDVKPANLLRADDGSVIVTDFGIARVLDAGITSATVGASTPLYAAPELLAENEASVQSEVYALGALTYALLAGRPAFSDSENIWATMHRVRTEMPAPIPGVPAPIMRVIQQAMAKDPGDRPASAAMFGDHLRTAQTAHPDWSPPMVTAELTDRTPGTSTLEPPPAPALDRPAPRAQPPIDGHRRTAEQTWFKAGAAVVAVAVVALAGWWGASRLLSQGNISTTPLPPPVDESLPSPTPGRTSSGTAATAEPQVTATPPQRLVSFRGQHFSALFPEGWSLLSGDIDEGYGFRSSFRADGMYLNIDTTPKEQREPGGDIAQSARDIAAGITSASDVRTDVVDGLEMHSFTFRNREGVDSIDIFFEVDGDGYAVVAGSATDPKAAFSTARNVALSIRSNPDQ